MAKIYHYTKLSTAIRYILPAKQLLTNSLSNTNDPRENQPWAFGGVNIDFEGIYPNTYNDNTHIDHQYQLGKEIKNRVQILCFVHSDERPGFENEMMWAHYTENHEGICLELDEEAFLNENANIPIFQLENVTYGTSKNPWLHWNRSKNKEENIDNFIRLGYKNLVLSKSEYWEREYEKRLLILSTDQHYLSIQNSLTGIYFGISMDVNYRPSIDQHVNPEQTKIYDLYYESQQLKTFERKIGDFRPSITKKYL
ncbi:DUF2971 domain-containing protein [Reichenbachiella agariperforans]|uniref:DUF2971 domain-containing protein n=1 Tax=Reichenbachiella agariperforans TaxID=156994 RepID=UPI001C0A1A39|nr:DUF2971 domain-containing protein [Reichenbachiella agariperforans]MBU2912932.1 DUF2971 domain-containing protein [Reichenbachiella agariperforans]